MDRRIPAALGHHVQQNARSRKRSAQDLGGSAGRQVAGQDRFGKPRFFRLGLHAALQHDSFGIQAGGLFRRLGVRRTARAEPRDLRRLFLRLQGRCRRRICAWPDAGAACLGVRGRGSRHLRHDLPGGRFLQRAGRLCDGCQLLESGHGGAADGLPCERGVPAGHERRVWPPHRA